MFFSLEKELAMAFRKQDNHHLKKIHTYLNQQYYDLLLNRDYKPSLDYVDWARFKYVESTWITHEMNDCINQYNCSEKINSAETIILIIQGHPVYNHVLFDYLEHEATYSDYKCMITQDAILNLEICNYLALSLPAMLDVLKKEMFAELWHKYGNQFHVILNSFNIEYERHQLVKHMSWEGLAEMNLFSYLSQGAFNKMKYVGLMTAVKLLDPPHYFQFIKGMKRVLKQSYTNINYYLNDELKAQQSIDYWIKKVVMPQLLLRPYQAIDFWLGFYLYLDFTHRYYDRLYMALKNKKAA